MTSFKKLTAYLALLLGLGTLSPAPGAAQEPPKPAEINFNGAGGDLGTITRKIFMEEYERRYGIKINNSSPSSMPKLKAMVESGSIQWTVAQIAGEDAHLAEELKLYEPIDTKIVDIAALPPEARPLKSVLYRGSYSTLFVYDASVYKTDAPKSWADFWDVKRFPGPRALQNLPVDNLEFALLADGVPMTKLYPLDVDRAFKKMDQIKPHVAVWWSTGQQPTQLLIDKEVTMSSGWAGRFFQIAQEMPRLQLVWNGSLAKPNVFGVPKGAKDAYWGQKLLAIFNEPKLQAQYAEQTGYPGTHPDFIKFIKPELAKFFPPQDPNVAGWTDLNWWTVNNRVVNERWNKWLLQK